MKFDSNLGLILGCTAIVGTIAAGVLTIIDEVQSAKNRKAAEQEELE